MMMSVSDLGQGKPELESRLKCENHAMDNELILKKIFGFCSVNDLKNCRLVCKKWLDLSLSFWRRNAVLRTTYLFPTCSFLEHWDYYEEREAYYVGGFKESASKLLENPFQRYDMNFGDFSSHPRAFKIEKKKMMLDFFSSSIQHLFIECDDMEMMCLLITKLPKLGVLHLDLNCQDLYPEYKSIISKGRECPLRDLQSALTKLYELKIDLDSYFRVNMNMNLNFPWKKVFESVPALKSFDLSFWGTCPTVSDQIMQAVCDVRREGNESTLKLDELRIRLGSTSARSIVESKFPLQKLSIIELDDSNRNNPSTILELLEAHAETLEYFDGQLKLYHCPTPLSPYLPSKVKLPKLKELILGNWVWAFHLLTSLDATNLEKLSISSIGYTRERERDIGGLILESDVFMGSCLLPNLNEFFFDAPMVTFRPTELRTLGKSMPNLTDLRIPHGEETFPIVCELWPELQSLHLFVTHLTYQLLDDRTITGFPVENCCVESRKFNITNLKNLRKFVLCPRGGGSILRPEKPFVTDFSAIHGFLELPKLETLHLKTVCKFSPSIMTALESRVSEIKISDPFIFVEPLDFCF